MSRSKRGYFVKRRARRSRRAPRRVTRPSTLRRLHAARARAKLLTAGTGGACTYTLFTGSQSTEFASSRGACRDLARERKAVSATYDGVPCWP